MPVVPLLTCPTGNRALSTGTEASSPRPQRLPAGLSVVKAPRWPVSLPAYTTTDHTAATCRLLVPQYLPAVYHTQTHTHTYELTRRQAEVNTITHNRENHHPSLFQTTPFLIAQPLTVC